MTVTTNNEPLRITEESGDTFEINLDPEKHPITYQRKLDELLQQGWDKEEAEKYITSAPFVLEMFYDIGIGMFAIESETVENCEIYNPHTGKEIPNENLPTKLKG